MNWVLWNDKCQKGGKRREINKEQRFLPLEFEETETEEERKKDSRERKDGESGGKRRKRPEGKGESFDATYGMDEHVAQYVVYCKRARESGSWKNGWSRAFFSQRRCSCLISGKIIRLFIYSCLSDDEFDQLKLTMVEQNFTEKLQKLHLLILTIQIKSRFVIKIVNIR